MTPTQRTPRQNGQGLVEFMLDQPFLLLVIMGIVKLAHMFAIYTMVSSRRTICDYPD